MCTKHLLYLVHSVIVCHVSGNLNIPGSLFQDHWYTLAYLNNQLRYIYIYILLSVPPMYKPAHQRLQETRTSEMIGPCSVQISSKFRHNYFHFHSPTEVTMLTGSWKNRLCWFLEQGSSIFSRDSSLWLTFLRSKFESYLNLKLKTSQPEPHLSF